MKKQYMNPVIDVIEIKSKQALMAGSATLPLGEPGSADDAEASEFFFDDEY